MVNVADNFVETSLNIHHEQAYALSKQLKKLLETNYPSNEILVFIRELNEINNKFLEIFSSKDVLINKIELYRKTFIQFQQKIELISQTNFSQHPAEVILPAEEILSKYREKMEIYTKPTWELNYSIQDIWSTFSKNIFQILNINDKNSEQKILIRFPIIHKDDVLLGAVMGHELGHFFDLFSGLRISESLLPKILQHENMNKLLNYIEFKDDTGILRISNKESIEVAKNVIRQILNEYFLRDWLYEFVADIAGIILYGPSSHFSGETIFKYSGFSNTGNLVDRFSTTHPRKIIRSKVRLETLKTLRYFDVLPEELKNEIENTHQQWLKSTTSDYNQYLSKQLNTSVKYRFKFDHNSLDLIEEMLMDTLPEIIKEVSEKIPESLHYNAIIYNAIVPQLSNKISNLIPPNETEDNIPSDSISIINAAWHAYYVHKGTIKRNLHQDYSHLELREIINNLAKKAITLANTHRRWNDARTNR